MISLNKDESDPLFGDMPLWEVNSWCVLACRLAIKFIPFHQIILELSSGWQLLSNWTRFPQVTNQEVQRGRPMFLLPL